MPQGRHPDMRLANGMVSQTAPVTGGGVLLEESAGALAYQDNEPILPALKACQ